MNDITALQQVPLFGGMDSTELENVRQMMKRRRYLAGQVIMREGEPGDDLHVLLEGRVQVLVRDVAGNELLLDEEEPGAFFGELSMLTGEPRSARIRAAEDVVTLSLERSEFLKFLEKYPLAAIDVLTVLGRRLHQTDALLRQSASQNANVVAEETLSLTEKIADKIAEFSGSMPFLILNTLWFLAWILWNQPWFPGYDFDPFPFGLLTMIVSLEAIFLSIFVLISQNRQAEKDRIAADIDHQVNTKAELGVGLLIRRLDDLEASFHRHGSDQTTLLRRVARTTGAIDPKEMDGGE